MSEFANSKFRPSLPISVHINKLEMILRQEIKNDQWQVCHIV